MLEALLCIMAVLPGALATLLEHIGGPLRLAERHHAHHDTYVVPPDFTRSLVVAMLVMGCTGVLLGVFCIVGLFDTTQELVLFFTDGFVMTMFVLWVILCRYKIALFEDRAVLTPFCGQDNFFFYSDIVAMDWAGIRRNSGYRDLFISLEDGRRLRVWGIIDIEQILLHTDRFDVLSPLMGDLGTDVPSIWVRAGMWQPFAKSDDVARGAAAASGKAVGSGSASGEEGLNID